MKKYNQPRLLCTSIAALMVTLPAWQAAHAQTEPSAATDAAYSTVENPPTAQLANTAPTTAAEAATAPQEDTLQRLKRWLQPISSQGVRADVLARALTATTGNDQGQQVAVPWTQAMPGGTQENGSERPDMQLEQNQLEEGKLQLISHRHQDTGNLELGLEQFRIEIPYSLPSGTLDSQRWSKPGTPLLSVGKSAFSILEFRRPGSIDFRRRHSALTEAASELVLKQGDRIAFNQVILDWNTGGGPNQFHQLMVLKGEQYNQFRVCINALGIMYRQLVCNVWQVPDNYWHRPQNLQYVGSYLVDEAGGNRYWRYKGQ